MPTTVIGDHSLVTVKAGQDMLTVNPCFTLGWTVDRFVPKAADEKKKASARKSAKAKKKTPPRK